MEEQTEKTEDQGNNGPKLPLPTGKRKVFAEEWVIDHNAARAAETAGYSSKSASRQGQDLLKNPNIAAYVKYLEEKATKEAGLSHKWVLKRLKMLADHDIRDLFDEDGELKPVESLTKEQAFALAGMTTATTRERGKRIKKDASGVTGYEPGNVTVKRTYKFADKRNPLVDIGKHLGMFDDKVNLGDTTIAALLRSVDGSSRNLVRYGADEETTESGNGGNQTDQGQLLDVRPGNGGNGKATTESEKESLS